MTSSQPLGPLFSNQNGSVEPSPEYTADGAWQRNEQQRQRIWALIQVVNDEPLLARKDITSRLWDEILGRDDMCKCAMGHRVIGCYMFKCKRCRQWSTLAINACVRSSIQRPIIPFRIEQGKRINEMYRIVTYQGNPSMIMKGQYLYSDPISNLILQWMNVSQVCKKYNVPTIQFETAFICGNTISVIERETSTKFNDVWTLLAPFEADNRATRAERLLSILQQLWVLLDMLSEIDYADKPMVIDDLSITRDMVSYMYKNRVVQGVSTIQWKPSFKAESRLAGSNIIAGPHSEVYRDRLRLSMNIDYLRQLWPDHTGKSVHKKLSLYHIQWPSLVLSLKTHSLEIKDLFMENEKLRRIDQMLNTPDMGHSSDTISDAISSILWS